MESPAASTSGTYTEELQNWIGQEKAAIRLINAVSRLTYERSIDLVLFRNPLQDKSISESLQLHKYAEEFVGKPISIEDTSALATGLLELDLAPAKIDIGKLAYEWHNEASQWDNHGDFLRSKLTNFLSQANDPIEPVDVVLYGFGRIGRLAARELIRQVGKGDQLRLKAIVIRDNSPEQLEKRAALLRMDSVHGPFPGTVDIDYEKKALIINGQLVKLLASNGPDQLDYESHGIKNALIIDNTGKWRDREALGLHLKSKGAARVLLTAPGGGVPNIVFGVNHHEVDVENETIYSAASCTTNAIVPILKVVENNLGVEKGHIETVHAYTNDQNLLDNFHKKHRRGRSAALNMVITETGAAKAAVKVMPGLKDKLTANAVRVPTPDGSLAIMNLTVGKQTSVDEVNDFFKSAALDGPLVEQIQYSLEEELVSNDIVGSSCPSVYDSAATLVHPDGRNIVLYVWYDNEYGYTRQVIRLAKYLTKVRRLSYY